MDIVQARRNLAMLLAEVASRSPKLRLLIFQIEQEHHCDLIVNLNGVVRTTVRDKAVVNSVARNEQKKSRKSKKLNC